MRAVSEAIVARMASVCVSARSVASCFCSRSIVRSPAFSWVVRSWTSTCSPVIVPSAERREIASWMCARGILRRQIGGRALACVDACTEVEKPPSDVATCRARLTPFETPFAVSTRSDRNAP